MDIPKAVETITDFEIVNFAREHHFITQEKRNYCILYRELGFKPGEALDLHLDDKNVDSKGRWRSTRTRRKCLQCNIALCTEGKCFEVYHRRLR
jgi:hypothetical protein